MQATSSYVLITIEIESRLMALPTLVVSSWPLRGIHNGSLVCVLNAYNGHLTMALV
jgi:hypothetical protein